MRRGLWECPICHERVFGSHLERAVRALWGPGDSAWLTRHLLYAIEERRAREEKR